MSSPSTTTVPHGPAGAPTFPRLLRVELRRMLSRRFTWALLALAVLGYVVTMTILWSSYSTITPEVTARAMAEREVQVANSQFYQEQCAAGVIPDGMTVDDYCGVTLTAEETPLEWFYDVDPFGPREITDLALVIGVAVAVAAFLLGATTIGAEWSTKNIVAWLFWEPRRLRLLGAKLVVLLAITLVLALLAQAIWLATAQVLLDQRGVPIAELQPVPEDFWYHTLGVQLRAALFVIPTALLGFGLANLIRNTAAAIGIVFVYSIGEGILGVLNPDWAPFQFTTSALAWIQRNGTVVYGEYTFNPSTGEYRAPEIPISNLQGGGVILLYAAAVLGVSVWLFRRRDIT